MILLIDNYDSFVHNLARYFTRLGQTTHVVRNNEIDVAGVRALRPAAVVFSPGPCTPSRAGNALQIVRSLVDELPMLGVCLGHQIIAEAFGARIVRDEPMHGQASPVFHDGDDLYDGLPNPLLAGRYHSLVVEPESLPDCLQVSARSEDGAVMGLRHRRRPIFGVQFHPESILTPSGYELLANFLKQAGLALPDKLPLFGDERTG